MVIRRLCGHDHTKDRPSQNDVLGASAVDFKSIWHTYSRRTSIDLGLPSRIGRIRDLVDAAPPTWSMRCYLTLSTQVEGTISASIVALPLVKQRSVLCVSSL